MGYSHFPDIAQLRPADLHLHPLHNLPLRHQGLVRLGVPRRLEIHHPGLLRRRGQLLHRAGIQVHHYAKRTVDQLLGYRGGRRALFPVPARALPHQPDPGHPHLYRRDGRSHRVGPYHRREWRQRLQQSPAQG